MTPAQRAALEWLEKQKYVTWFQVISEIDGRTLRSLWDRKWIETWSYDARIVPPLPLHVIEILTTLSAAGREALQKERNPSKENQ